MTTTPRAVTSDDLAGWLKLVRQSPEDEAALVPVASAVSAYVNGLPHLVGQADDVAWDDATRLGALMLGARLFRRRNSPGGVESFGDAGVAYTARQDPDVGRLLKLNAPRVG